VAFLAISASQAVSDVTEKTPSEFVFARVQFNMDGRWIFDYREAPWHHDYPFSEDLFLTMVKEVTEVNTARQSFQTVRLDSPDIFKYPWVYISEPGYFEMTPKEVANFREYLTRGGFAICDDFRGHDLDVLRFEMKKVFPDREMFRLDASHPIFHSFYEINSLEMDPPYGKVGNVFTDSRYLGEGPQFWGINDDKGRLIMVANRNNDLGEFMEDVDHGDRPFKWAALAVKLMVNYLVYAMTR
jgi:Domain of unknown function (DUF4159)